MGKTRSAAKHVSTPGAASSVPVTVIAGFLGAGKTSYLNERIARGDASDALVIVNDLGAVNVDQELIDFRDDRLLALTNGCLCCTLGGTLAEQLAQALRLHESPRSILIEASGVAEPERIADIARLAAGLHLAEVVVLVDASQARRLAADALVGELWRTQLAAADRLLVNRLPGEDHGRQVLMNWIASFANADITAMAGEPVAEAVVAPMLRLAEPRGGALSRGSTGGHGKTPRPGHGLDNASVSFSGAVAAEALARWLEAYDDVLLRAKGVLYCRRQTGDAWVSLQLSGSRLRWRDHRPSTSRSTLVCIGRQGARFDALMAGLRSLSTAPVAPLPALG